MQPQLRLTNLVSHLMTMLLQFSSFSCSDAVQSLRAKTAGTKRLTQGLPLDLLKPFNNDSLLNRALADANKQFDVLVQKHGHDFVVRDEDVLSQEMQKGFVNFYGVSMRATCQCRYSRVCRPRSAHALHPSRSPRAMDRDAARRHRPRQRRLW